MCVKVCVRENDVTLFLCYLCLCEGLCGGDNDVTLFMCHLYMCESLLEETMM